jgi:hypothetical protein
LIPDDATSTTSSADERVLDQYDDSACEHYLAFVRNWHTRCLDEETGNRRVKFLREGAFEFIELRAIDCAVGKVSTARGDWVVSASVHPVRNPVDLSDDETSDSEGGGPN